MFLTDGYSDRLMVVDPADDVSVEKTRRQVDKYFTRTRETLEEFGDKAGLWAVYLRVPSVAAFRRATGFMTRVLNELGAPVTIADAAGEQTYEPRAGVTQPAVKIFLPYKEGEQVRGGGQPILYYYGPGSLVSELETGLLARLGPASVAAANTREMCRIWPEVDFIDMSARHCPDGAHNGFAYGAAVGSDAAKAAFNAKGFIGTSTDEAAHWFGKAEGMGTIPHAAVNAAGSTLEAARRYHAKFPHLPLIFLPDFYGQEVTDSIAVGRHFNELEKQGRLAARLDTHGARFLEGLDLDKSHDIIEKRAPHMLERKLSPLEQKWLFDKGVSVAAVFHMREQLDTAGLPNLRLVVSSGFSGEKCALFKEAGAPVNMVGTGSWLPDRLEETYAKSETLGYVNSAGVLELSAKDGREWVVSRWERDRQKAGFTI